MLGLGANLAKGGASLLTFVKDNLKLYLDFKSSRSDTLAFPSDGSTSFVTGSSQHINIGVQSSLQFASGTYAVWIYPTGNGVIYSRYVGPSYDIRWEVSGTTILCAINSINRVTTPTDSITLNAWNHVAISISSSSILTYVNGSLVDTDSGIAIDTNAVANKIGYGDFGTYFGGKMANLGAWSRILSPEEVQSVMNKSYSQLGSVEKTSLVMWQSLDSETASGRTPIEQNAKTETTPQEAENKIVLNSHGTTTYTQILNESDRTFASQGNWVQGSGTFEFGNTDVYSEGALKISSAGWVYLATNGSGFDTALVSGSIYKIQFTWTVVDTSHAQNFWFGIDSSFANYGLWRRYQFNTDQLPEAEQVVTIYHQHDGGNYFYFRNTASSSCEFHIKNISCELIGNNVGISNATTTTSVYGGNAPILPRAVDVAKEGQADAIGNGSASFNGSSDHIVLSDSSPNTAFSISAWVFDTHSSGSDFSAIYSANSTSIWFGVKNNSSGLVRLHINGNSNYADTPSNSFSSPSNEWIHLVGTWDGTNAKIYINGVSQTLSVTGTLANPTASANPAIGINDSNLSFNQWNGNIAQVGIWRGALSQAQIQSLMESTSYAKIPADVKSTLSQRVTNGSFDTDSDWSKGEGWSINDTNGTASASGIGGFNYLSQSNIFDDASALYKMTITIDSAEDLTNAGIVRNGTIQSFQNSFGITSVGTHTVYLKNSTANLLIYSNGVTTTISNISIEKVTNELVAYYPLDGSSSANGVTNDVTTGEVLGSEISGDPTFDNASNWIISLGTGSLDVNTTVLGKLSAVDAQDKRLQKYSILTVGKLYKVTFVIDSYSSGRVRGLLDTAITFTPTGTGTYSRYFVASNTFFLVSFDGTANLTMTDISIKEVTSNTGVLK